MPISQQLQEALTERRYVGKRNFKLWWTTKSGKKDGRSYHDKEPPTSEIALYARNAKGHKVDLVAYDDRYPANELSRKTYTFDPKTGAGKVDGRKMSYLGQKPFTEDLDEAKGDTGALSNVKKKPAPHMWYIAKTGRNAWVVSIGDPRKSSSKTKRTFHNKDDLKDWAKYDMRDEVSPNHVIDRSGLKLVSPYYTQWYVDNMMKKEEVELAEGKLKMGAAKVDASATASIKQVKLKAKNRGDLQSAVISAGYYAKKHKKTAYVYPGNAYGRGVWRVTYDKSEALNPVNNSGVKLMSVTPDLTVTAHALSGGFGAE
jgi:hypothetical protein